MSTLKELKQRKQSITSIHKITRAMKMIAATKLKKAQHQLTLLRPYATEMTAVLTRVLATQHFLDSVPLLLQKIEKNQLRVDYSL